MRSRESQRGFTLTEVLMAVGILGVGLTMVASIFPVAVDQSRLSRDQTYAALCARSGAAMIRIMRNDILAALRDRDHTMQDLSSLPAVANSLSDASTIYDPAWFLYRSDSPRSYNDAQTWTKAGHYAFRVFSGRTSTSGPHRIAIAVCKTSGAGVENPIFSRTKLVLLFWSNTGPGQTILSPKAGQYVLSRSTGQTMGYLLDYVQNPDNRSLKTGYLACGRPYQGAATIPPDATTCVLPGIIAVYHTYLGE